MKIKIDYKHKGFKFHWLKIQTYSEGKIQISSEYDWVIDIISNDYHSLINFFVKLQMDGYAED